MKPSESYRMVLNSDIWPKHIEEALQSLIAEAEAHENSSTAEMESELAQAGIYVDLAKTGTE